MVRDFYITTGNLKRALKFHLNWIDNGVPCTDETAGSRYKLLGSGGPEGGPGRHYIAFIFVFIDGNIIC